MRQGGEEGFSPPIQVLGFAAMNRALLTVLASLFLAVPAFADSPFDILNSDNGKKVQKAVGDQAASSLNAKVAKKVNAKLLAESRKNQCSFKVDSDELEPGCDKKAKNLADALVWAKKTLDGAQVRNYKFVVSGHTDSSGSESHNKELSKKRAEAMVKQLVAKGINANEIEAVGMGSEQPLVKPDNTPAKKAKNRRYELAVRF